MYKARLCAEASLKTMERQAEDQRQKLHLTEIDLATQRQLVIDLKVELQKAKEAAQLAKEATEAEKSLICSAWRKCKLGLLRSFQR